MTWEKAWLGIVSICLFGWLVGWLLVIVVLVLVLVVLVVFEGLEDT